MKTLKDQNGEKLETGNKDILDTEFSLKSKSKKQCNFMSIAHCTFNILVVNSIRQGNQDRNSKKKTLSSQRRAGRKINRGDIETSSESLFLKKKKAPKHKISVKPWYFC